MRSHALEMVCSTFPIRDKKPQMKAFLESALYQQRCLNCNVELKAVLIKLLQVTDFAQTKQSISL